MERCLVCETGMDLVLERVVEGRTLAKSVVIG